MGYKSFLRQVYAHPTPTPPLRWEGSGCARKQVDGLRVQTSGLYDAPDVLLPKKIRVCPCMSVAKRMFVRARHCLLPSASSPFSTAFFVFLHRHFLPCGVRAPSYSSPRAVLLESIRQTTRVLSPSGLESCNRKMQQGLRFSVLKP